MYDAISEVQAVVLANEGKCNTFRQQYSRFEYLWKKDLTASLQVRPASAFSSSGSLQLQQSCCSYYQPAGLVPLHLGRSGTGRLSRSSASRLTLPLLACCLLYKLSCCHSVLKSKLD